MRRHARAVAQAFRPACAVYRSGTPGGIRTHDLRLRGLQRPQHPAADPGKPGSAVPHWPSQPHPARLIRTLWSVATTRHPRHSVDGLGRKEHRYSRQERLPTWTIQSDQQQTGVRAWRVPTKVGEVQVLRDQESLCGLGDLPHVRVVTSRQSLGANRVDVVAQCAQLGNKALREVLVEFDVHRLTGSSPTGRSSFAEVAAKAMAALTSSSESVGKSARISAVVAPSARLARTVLSVTRVPLNTAWPPTMRGSRTIRSW